MVEFLWAYGGSGNLNNIVEIICISHLKAIVVSFINNYKFMKNKPIFKNKFEYSKYHYQ